MTLIDFLVEFREAVEDEKERRRNQKNQPKLRKYHPKRHR
jgi:hypothetical protein